MTPESTAPQTPRSGPAAPRSGLDVDGDTVSIPAPIAPGHSATPRSGPAAPRNGLCGRAIDWAALARLRPETIVNEGVPPYLLLPEIRALIEQAPTVEQSVFFELLFVTGARIGEAELLTPASFYLAESAARCNRPPHVILPTLKRRQRRGRLPTRLINLEPDFTRRLRQYLGSARRRAEEPVFPQSRRTHATWCAMVNDRHPFDIRFSAKTLRHSCGVHLILLGFDTKFVQQYLGHANAASTDVYTAVALPLLAAARPAPSFR